MNRDQTKEVFKLIKNVYPQFEVTSEKIDTWTSLLSDQNPAVVMKNTEHHVLSKSFPPTIADIREVKHPSYQSNIIEQIKQWEKEAVGVARS